MNLRKNSQHPN